MSIEAFIRSPAKSLLQRKPSMRHPLKTGTRTAQESPQKTYLNRFVQDHQNPISCACLRGDNSLLKMLLDHGLRPSDDTGDALLVAVGMRNKLAVTLLLGHGADPNVQANRGLNTALHAAICKDPQWISQIRYNPVWRDHTRKVPEMEWVADFERTEREIIRLLVHAGAQLNNHLQGFETPLHVAILDSNIEMQSLLIGLGADLDIPNYRGATARHLLGPELTRMLIDMAYA